MGLMKEGPTTDVGRRGNQDDSNRKPKAAAERTDVCERSDHQKSESIRWERGQRGPQRKCPQRGKPKERIPKGGTEKIPMDVAKEKITEGEREKGRNAPTM